MTAKQNEREEQRLWMTKAEGKAKREVPGLAVRRRERHGQNQWGIREKGKKNKGAAAAPKGWRLQPPPGEKKMVRDLGYFFFRVLYVCFIFWFPFPWWLNTLFIEFSKVKNSTSSFSLRAFFNLVLNFQFVRFDPALTVKSSICSILPL